jgi:phosphoribosylformylglycinamidine synthase PurS subunit
MRYNAQVHVTLKPTVNDPQGNAVLGSLQTLGFASVEHVRVGKFLTLTLDAADEGDARTQVDAMCDKLLANTVIESYETEISPLG